MNQSRLPLSLLAMGLAGLLGFASCGGDGTAGVEAPAAGEADASQPKALEAAVRELRCGCKIDEIGKCGNYVAVGDSWLEISNREDHGLGTMEWCRVDIKVEANVAGTQTGDKIHVESMELAAK